MEPSGPEALSCSGSIISATLVVNQADDDVPHDRLHCLIHDHRTASWFQADFVGSGKWFRRPSGSGQFVYRRIVHWKADRPKRILGTCPNRVIDPVNAARFMTAASTLQRLARSAALNASYAAGPSRTGTPLGCLDIGSSPVQLRVRMTTTPNAPRDSNQLAKIY